MLRDRVSSFWALEVACPRGGSNPLSPLFVPAPAWRHVPRGTVGPPVPLFLFLLGYSNHKPPTPSLLVV